MGDNMTSAKLGNYIREKRTSKGLTLRGLAELAGLSFSHLSKIERGEHQPSDETIEVLAKSLDISKSELFSIKNFTDDELNFWREIYIKNNVANTNPFDRENVTDSEVITYRNNIVHKSYSDIITTDYDKNITHVEVKGKVNTSGKFSKIIDEYRVSLDDKVLFAWEDVILEFIQKGLTPEDVRSRVNSNSKNKLMEMAFGVIAAQNNMFSNEVQYHHIKSTEGKESTHTINAYNNYLESQGYYNKLIYGYMNTYFNQPNPNPFEDRLLRKKFPIEYDYQRDLFNGVQVNLKCADGYIINNVKYYTGGYAGDVLHAEEKAQKYIDKQLKHFRQI